MLCEETVFLKIRTLQVSNGIKIRPINIALGVLLGERLMCWEGFKWVWQVSFLMGWSSRGIWAHCLWLKCLWFDASLTPSRLPHQSTNLPGQAFLQEFYFSSPKWDWEQKVQWRAVWSITNIASGMLGSPVPPLLLGAGNWPPFIVLPLCSGTWINGEGTIQVRMELAPSLLRNSQREMFLH